jgi:hypothetical protein
MCQKPGESEELLFFDFALTRPVPKIGFSSSLFIMQMDDVGEI